MYSVPAEPQGDLMRAQLAGVEQPEHLDAVKHAAAQRIELVHAVLP